MKNNKVCGRCKQPLIGHGNRRYHQHCAYEQKKDRSIQEYSRLHHALDLYWRNEKILKDCFYHYGGSTEVDPHILENVGFDFDIKSEIRYSGTTPVFVMKKYGFSITPNKKIILWKL